MEKKEKDRSSFSRDIKKSIIVLKVKKAIISTITCTITITITYYITITLISKSSFKFIKNKAHAKHNYQSHWVKYARILLFSDQPRKKRRNQTT